MKGITLLAVTFVLGWLALAQEGSGQDYNNRIGVDVTPQAQVDRNRENDKKELEERQKAEARAEAARQRAAELQRARIRAQAELERERIRARGEVEAAEKRNPDMCLNCVLLR
jgi:hypothetical protein